MRFAGFFGPSPALDPARTGSPLKTHAIALADFTQADLPQAILPQPFSLAGLLPAQFLRF